MKFRFPLQKVLEHRKTVEDIAQRDFREAQSFFLKQEELLARMIEDLRLARERAGAVATEGGSRAPESLKQIYEFEKGQQIRIQRQKLKVEEANQMVEAKREILRQKAVDFKILEKLKERRKEEFLFNVRIEEQKETDEINVLRFDAKDGE